MKNMKYSTNYTELLNTIVSMSDDQQFKLLNLAKKVAAGSSNARFGHRMDYPSVFAIGIFMGSALMGIIFTVFTLL